jgi:hypothetical protein
MLDLSFSTELITRVWNSLPEKSQLHCDDEEFFSQSGAATTLFDTRRQYYRIHARGQAILIHGDRLYGIYTIDVSPNGVGLICPVQLFTRERVELRSDKIDKIPLEVCRCRRPGPQSYECGTVFHQGRMNPSTYKQFLNQLRV